MIKMHPEKALTALRVKNAKKSGRYADGNGLYLQVDPSGAKRWIWRGIVQGRRRDLGLGSCRLVPLAEARELAVFCRKAARAGDNPLDTLRKPATTTGPTFAECAKVVFEERRVLWKNPKHGKQWMASLESHAMPVIGERSIADISPTDITAILSPIWFTTPETARRIKDRLHLIFKRAIADQLRIGPNPVDLAVDGLGNNKSSTEKHHAALDYDDLPAFMAKLALREMSIARLGLEFLILTACRTTEVRCARWDEITLETDPATGASLSTWTIPAERMKTSRPHRVPLSDACVEVLTLARRIGCGSEYVFPGQSQGKPLSNMGFLQLLKRMEVKVTAHGFRATFRDWSAEETDFPNEVAEMALAHVVKNASERAYRRGDLFDKRRGLMDAWAAFAKPGAPNVVALKASQTAGA